MKASTPQILKNAKGGIRVSEGDIKAAFDFFDVDGKGVITTPSLRKRLSAFHRSLSAREARVLMNDEAELRLEDLREVLLENEVSNFDPVAEAFKVYDPEDTGFMDPEILRRIFDNLGFGEVSDGDLRALLDTADGDGDGRLGIDDFRRLCDSSKTGDSDSRDEPKDGSKDGLEDSEKTQANEQTISA